MANVSRYLSKACLDWALGGAAPPSAPSTRALGLSLGVPSSISGSEMATGSGYTRQTVTWQAADTPASSATATNVNTVSFGPFLSAASISGMQVWDTILTNNSGSMLFYGTLTTPRTVNAGDSLVFAPGALIITLA